MMLILLTQGSGLPLDFGVLILDLNFNVPSGSYSG